VVDWSAEIMRMVRIYRMKRKRPPQNGGHWGGWKQVSKHKYLAWVPGRDWIWEENTEELFRRRFAERLTRA
jgi:hypothetical protein